MKAIAIVMVLATPAVADKDSKAVTKAKATFASLTSGKGPIFAAFKDQPVAYDLQSPDKACKGLGGKTFSATSQPQVEKLRSCIAATAKKVTGAKANIFEQKAAEAEVSIAKHLKTAPKGTVVVVGNWTTGASTMNVTLTIGADDIVNGVWMDYEESADE
jgi:hypothetical protein